MCLKQRLSVSTFSTCQSEEIFNLYCQDWNNIRYLCEIFSKNRDLACDNLSHFVIMSPKYVRFSESKLAQCHSLRWYISINVFDYFWRLGKILWCTVTKCYQFVLCNWVEKEFVDIISEKGHRPNNVLGYLIGHW